VILSIFSVVILTGLYRGGVIKAGYGTIEEAFTSLETLHEQLIIFLKEDYYV
jgi:hypothetical protein